VAAALTASERDSDRAVAALIPGSDQSKPRP
jgi:hypothetical protein